MQLRKNTNKMNLLQTAVYFLIILLLCSILFFINESIKSVSKTNENNFSYSIKIRNTIDKIDSVFDRAEINIKTLNDLVVESYDLSKQHDIKYNKKYIKQLDLITKSVLINSPNVSGVWFQLNHNFPYAYDGYVWYCYDHNKIINVKDKLKKNSPTKRKLSPKNDPYYFNAIKQKGLYYSDIYIDYDLNKKMITIAEPVFKNNVLIGVSGIDISVRRLEKIMQKMQDSFEGSEIFLVNHSGNIVVAKYSKTEKDYDDVDRVYKKLMEQGYNSVDDQKIEYDDHNIKKTAIKLVLNKNYDVIVTFPNKIIFKGYSKLFYTIYFIFLLLTILAILAAINKYELLQMNKKLQFDKNTLRLIFDSSPNIAVLKDVDGTYKDCNNKFAEIVKLPIEEIIGKKDEDLFEGETLVKLKKADSFVKEILEPYVDIISITTSDDITLSLETHALPIFASKKSLSGILLIAFDTTKIMEQQELLKKAKENAEKTTEIKSNFLANMSHEIRTPMNGVLGFLQLLKETDTTSDQDELINDIQKASNMLLEIINDILDFSKIEAEKLSIENISFDIRSVVEDITISATVNADKKGLDINSLICTDVPLRVFGDPVRIKQILNNFVSNALKFTNKGEVLIFVKQIWEDADTSVISFRVKDTGIGIPEDKLKLIFNAFTQADTSTTRKYGGTGLGLAISSKLAELMNGSISVDSKEGEGSTFTFIIPFQKDKTVVTKHNNSPEIIKGSNILVVDSSLTDLKIFNYYLAECNCFIHKATSLEKALEILDDQAQNISTILFAFKMNNINGIDFLSMIRNNSKYSNIPLIIYTSLSKKFDINKVKEVEYDAYLIKPIKKKLLIETIANVLTEKKSNEQRNIKNISNNDLKFDSSARILTVEDSDINCKLISQILNNTGLSCDMVYNGQEGVEAFTNNKYDLILMDCQMPIMDGYEAAQKIRIIESGASHVPIVAMTANAMPTDREKCIQAGMDDYISKPINIPELLSIISKYIKTADKPDFEATNTPEQNSNNALSGTIDEIINLIVSELGLERSLAFDLLSDYIKYLPAAINEIEGAINASDFDNIRALAHKLKGASANLRITYISNFAAELEKIANENNVEACINILSEIKAQAEVVKESFCNFTVK